MPVDNVPYLQSQLNLEHDSYDYQLLTEKMEAAQAYCASYIGAPIPDPAPAAIRQAVLMLAAYWYEMREAATTGGNPYVVPFGVHDLLQAHRRWVV
jgi:uncharacterized phiE125 gp8 family phage protein